MEFLGIFGKQLKSDLVMYMDSGIRIFAANIYIMIFSVSIFVSKSDLNFIKKNKKIFLILIFFFFQGNIETKFDNPDFKSRNMELRRRLDL